MKIVKIYAELQMNPRNLAAYRKLIEYYKNQNMTNESKAFEELIKRKFNVDNSNTDEK